MVLLDGRNRNSVSCYNLWFEGLDIDRTPNNMPLVSMYTKLICLHDIRDTRIGYTINPKPAGLAPAVP